MKKSYFKYVLLFALGLVIGYLIGDFDSVKAGYEAGGNFNQKQTNNRIRPFNEFINLRNAEDLNKFTRSQLNSLEKKYQIANKNWGTEKATNTLIELVNDDEYNGANRIGCALLYLGQSSDIDQQEQYLLRAKNDYSNSWYGDGVNVGAFATYKLFSYYSYKGDLENAEKSKFELLEKYSDYVDHRGNYLKDIIPTES